ncbi:hypothetical protein [Escherichia coli]|uniref:hypothetical protein n=1 Tax=Escherichia coli TaxID=562 RepID=UPI0038908604
MFKPTYLARLQACCNKFELADLLQIKVTFLTNVLYRIRPENQYKKFTIKKKSGGEREIFAPDEKLKDIQQRLSELLYICEGKKFGQKIILNKMYHMVLRRIKL